MKKLFILSILLVPFVVLPVEPEAEETERHVNACYERLCSKKVTHFIGYNPIYRTSCRQYPCGACVENTYIAYRVGNTPVYETSISCR